MSCFPYNMTTINEYMVLKIDMRNVSAGDRYHYIGRSGNSASDVDICEIIGYSAELSAADEAQVGGYLAWKYGITTSYTAYDPPATIGIENTAATNIVATSADLAGTLGAPQAVEIFSLSFESPDVSGRVHGTTPDGWVLSLGAYGTGSFGVIDEDCGYFSTPYGAQVLSLWGYNRSVANSDSNTIEQVLVAEYPYTVSFNVVKQTDISGGYTVQLVAYDPGEPRNGSTDTSYGTVLAGVSGAAVLSDMGAAMDAFTFTADVDNPNVGKQLGVRVWGGGTIDNLKLTWIPPPPAGTVLILR